MWYQRTHATATGDQGTAGSYGHRAWRALWGAILCAVISVGYGAGAAAQSGSVRFAVIGDYGLAGSPEQAVANLVRSWNPDLIITTGDNNYYYGEASTIDANIGQYYHDFIYPYLGSYGPGASVNRFFPSLGNHDWEAPGAQPYLTYFDLPGNERYYDFVWGPVHFFSIDSDPREPDGTSASSVQAAWLENALAASTARWRIVYFHHPPYSSAVHGSSTRMQWPFEAWGASAVLSGHDHTYERVTQGDFPFFVNGLGGAARYAFQTVVPGSQVRFNADHGAMLVEATDASVRFRFFTRAGALVDTYTLYADPDASPPAAPGALDAVAVSGTRIDLVWADHASNESAFLIERSLDGVTFTQVAGVGPNITVYSALGLSPSTSYWYRVRASNPSGYSAFSNVAAETTLGGGPPTAPTGLTATPVSSSRIDLAWMDQSGNEEGFRIERSTNGTTFALVASVGAGATTYSVNGLSVGVLYWFRVQAYNGAGPSPYSNTVTARTKSPDLAIQGLGLSAASVAAGQSVTVSYSVKNQGTATVTQVYTDRIYLSSNTTLETPGDVLLGTSHGHTAELSANATHGHTQAVTVPAGTPPGNYYVLVQADALAAVTEGNEGNNVTTAAVTVTTSAPSTKDLVIAGLTVSKATVSAGGSVTVSYSVKNQGTTAVTETYTDRIYLSSDATLGTGDTLLATSHGHTADLGPNATHGHSQTVTIPAGTAPAGHFILVRADALTAVTEADEANNVTAIGLTVTAPPPSGKDLVIEGLALSTGPVAPGGSLTASYLVANRGTVKVSETYTDRLYLSANATLDASDVLLGTSHGHTADLSPNATHSHSQRMAVPAGTAPGSYYILGQTDAFAAVIEASKTNNVSAAPLSVSGP